MLDINELLYGTIGLFLAETRAVTALTSSILDEPNNSLQQSAIVAEHNLHIIVTGPQFKHIFLCYKTSLFHKQQSMSFKRSYMHSILHAMYSTILHQQSPQEITTPYPIKSFTCLLVQKKRTYLDLSVQPLGDKVHSRETATVKQSQSLRLTGSAL